MQHATEKLLYWVGFVEILYKERQLAKNLKVYKR